MIVVAGQKKNLLTMLAVLPLMVGATAASAQETLGSPGPSTPATIVGREERTAELKERI